MKQKHDQISDNQIIECFNKHKHIGKISHELNLPHISVWRRLKKLGLKTEKSGSGKKIELEEILDGKHPYYQTFKLKNRILKEGLFEYKCVSCNNEEWMGNKIPLQLDHINGDSSDHRKDNLRLLCPNCHSQTDTWCGKNKK